MEIFKGLVEVYYHHGLYLIMVFRKKNRLYQVQVTHQRGQNYQRLSRPIKNPVSIVLFSYYSLLNNW